MHFFVTKYILFCYNIVIFITYKIRAPGMPRVRDAVSRLYTLEAMTKQVYIDYIYNKKY